MGQMTRPGLQGAYDAFGDFLGVQGAGGKTMGIATPGRHIGTRIFDGRIAATHTVDATNGTTYEAIFTLAEVPDVVRPIFANGGATPYTLSKIAAAAVSEADMNGVNSIWGVAAAGADTVPASPGTTQPGLLRGNQILIDNPSASKMVAVRCFIAAGAGTITIMGAGANGGATNFTNWASRTGLVHAFRQQTGDSAYVRAAFTSVTNISYSPIIGVEYVSRGKVVTIMLSGDSIDAGQGTYLSDSPTYQAARQVQRAGYSLEIANLAWSGSTGQFSQYTPGVAFAAGIKPDYLVRPCASPNDVSTSIPDTTVRMWRLAVAKAHADCAENGVTLMLRTMTPANSSIDSPVGAENYGADDAKRVALNAEVLTWRARGAVVFDWSKAISGAVNANGQVAIAAGFTTDALHPNDAGNAAIAANILAENTLP